ncbi:glutamate mutase L [Haloglycomyces albus]|uniref:glutamate mutase L n=1 Tax=Haloglycomyces albus TaxID=526067 RepID=UPI0004A3CFF8|nr:glutamate mutase L [Haloglycomyces albus]
MTGSHLCLDIGSTYTKALHVTSEGRTSFLSHRTTLDTDVAEGVAAVASGVSLQSAYACSSAGGGLRLAVIGNEPLVTARAAYQSGLSAGAKVVHVGAGDGWAAAEVAAAQPDLILLAGGTDGGDGGQVVSHARRLAQAARDHPELTVPVIYAGNSEVTGDVRDVLSGFEFTSCENVLPRIGELNPEPARARLRDAFLEHVIGGKHLTSHTEVLHAIAMPTPDAMLAGVEFMSREVDTDIVVVDVGGATTDVYSARRPDPEISQVNAEVSGTAWNSRTVEGDLGLRHNARGIAEAAVSEKLLTEEWYRQWEPHLDHRVAHPEYLASPGEEAELDQRLCTLAARIAVRRHARGQRIGGPQQPRRGAKNLKSTGLLIASGGFFRAHPRTMIDTLRSEVIRDTAGGIQPPRDAEVRVDTGYLLFAIGLLGKDKPHLAQRLTEIVVG